jgi:hypothetical protein
MLAAAIESDNKEVSDQILSNNKNLQIFSIIYSVINGKFNYDNIQRNINILDQNMIKGIAEYAVRYHQNDLFNKLYPKLTNVDDAVIIIAVKNNNIYVLELLQNNINNIDILIKIAISHKYLSVIKWLYNYADNKNITIKLLSDIRCSNFEIMKWFIENKGYNNFESIIKQYSYIGNIDAIKYCIAHLVSKSKLDNNHQLKLLEIINCIY